MKKWIALYLVGAIFTNSYIRIHRSGEWVKEYRENYPSVSDNAMQMDIGMSCIFGSAFWPIYIAVRASDAIVSTKLKVEAPEILNR